MLEVTPNCGIGPISIGMTRKDVAEAMHEHTQDAKHTLQRDIYAQGKVVVDYENEQVIAVCINREPYIPSLEPSIFGFNPLKQQAHQTIMRMSAKDIYDHTDPELGMSYIYPQLGVYYWRDTTPETLQQEMQIQRTADGEVEAWYQEALQDYQYFHVIGVFAPGYL